MGGVRAQSRYLILFIELTFNANASNKVVPKRSRRLLIKLVISFPTSQYVKDGSYFGKAAEKFNKKGFTNQVSKGFWLLRCD